MHIEQALSVHTDQTVTAVASVGAEFKTIPPCKPHLAARMALQPNLA